jgi:hypothetical protein
MKNPTCPIILGELNENVNTSTQRRKRTAKLLDFPVRGDQRFFFMMRQLSSADLGHVQISYWKAQMHVGYLLPVMSLPTEPTSLMTAHQPKRSCFYRI